jgi:hypothetical protein
VDINILLGIGGLIIAVISLIYAIYVSKKGKQEKKLVYEVMSPVPVADVLQGKSAYSLRVVYKQADAAPTYIEHAFTQFLRFINIGHVPINKSDLTDVDALRIEIIGGNVLAATLVSETREACKIVLHPLEVNENDDITTIHLDFNFLDYLDGALIQLLTGREQFQTSLKGTIIGMPNGITKSENRENTELPIWGCAIVIVSILLAFGASLWGFKYFTGGWANSWVIFLPLATLIFPVGCLTLIMYFLGSRNKFEFPKQLFPPSWYTMKRYAASRFSTIETKHSKR